MKMDAFIKKTVDEFMDEKGGASMSTRELCYQLLDTVPEFKLSLVLAYLQGLTASEDAEDDFYCNALYQAYLDDPDRDIEYTLEDCKKEWGLA